MYNYADSTLLAYVPLGDEMGTPQQRANPETQRAFAFYERKRILEIAKPEGSDYTFLALYKRSYNTFVNRNPYAPVGERSREGRRKIQQWVAKERTEALTRNTSTNDDLSGVIKTYGSRERNNFDMINYPQPGQWGIRRGKLVLDSDYLRRGGGPAPYNAQGYQLVSLEDDIVSYWRSLIAGPTSSRNNDLIKIAINHLYFVLSYQTQLRIADINPDDPSSSVSLLKRHLGLS
jgi:hypothetical protein